jgi:hypothetical protein
MSFDSHFIRNIIKVMVGDQLSVLPVVKTYAETFVQPGCPAGMPQAQVAFLEPAISCPSVINSRFNRRYRLRRDLDEIRR